MLEGQEVRWPSRKSLGLLAYLALEGATLRDRLAELLWSALETKRARHSLRQELYLISRTALGQILEVGQERVALRVGVEVDVLTFKGLAETGNISEALALPQGALLDGYHLDDAETFNEWLSFKRESLNALRRELLGRQAEILENRSDLRGALRLYLDLLQEDPLQEAHERAAIRLHITLGERERGLQRFETFRALLMRELGLEPLPETVREAERAGTESPRPSALPALPEGPPLSPPLIGRDDAWRSLEQGQSTLTLLLGEPGVGKTRLALAFATTFGPPAVLRGHEVSRATPLYPVAEAIRAALHEPSRRARLDELPPVLQAEISRLVPDFPTPLPHAPEGRARFIEALGQALMAIAGPDGALVWDDLQWIDQSSLEVLSHLVRRAAQAHKPPRLLATARRDEALLRDDLQSMLLDLQRDKLVARIALQGLNSDEVHRLVQALSGSHAAPLFSQRLYAATGGNPLFVLETLRYLFETRHLREEEGIWTSPFDEVTSDYAELPIPPEVRDVVLGRVKRLNAAARRLLEAASVCGDVFHLRELSASVALSEWDALEPLESLLAAQIWMEHGDGYRFSHDLIRRAVHAELSGQRRRLLHGRLAHVLQEREAEPARIADHFESAGEHLTARIWRIRAAQEATRIYAYREALRQYERALETNPEPEQAYVWSLARVDLMRILDDREACEVELGHLDLLASQIGEPAKRAEVSVRWSLLHDQAGRYDLAMRSASQAASEPGLVPELRAQALHCLGTAWVRQLDFAAAEPLFLEGLAHENLSYGVRARLLDSLAHCALQRNDHRQAAEYNKEAQANWQDARDRRGLAVSHNTAARLAMLSGNQKSAIDHMREAMQQARAVGDLNLTKSFIANLVQVLRDDGQLDAAVEAVSEGLDLVHEARDRSGEGRLQNRLGDVQLLRGRLGAALAAYQQAYTIATELGQSSNRVHALFDQVRTLLLIGHTRTVPALLNELEHLVASTSASLSRSQMELELARYEWLTGHSAEAEQRLNVLWDSRDSLNPRIREGLAALLARVRFSRGDRTSPPTLTAGLVSTPTLRATALMLALRCEQGLSAIDEAELLLGSGRIDPIIALELQQSLAVQLASADSERAKRHIEEARALLVRLYGTLPAELKEDFLRWYTVPQT